MNRTIFVAAIVALLLLPAICPAATYTITDLGTLGGAGDPPFFQSQGLAINNSGQATGDSISQDGYRAYLYSSGTMQDLGVISGADPGAQSFGQAINDAGQVVGYGDASGNLVHAFLYDGAVLQDIGTLGGRYSFAHGINNSGQIVGVSNLTGDPPQNDHAFVYDGGVMTDLGALGGAANSSVARAINDSGQIVGYSTYGVPNGGTHAFLFDNGAMHDLGTLGGTESQAYAINASGEIVGVAHSVVADSLDLAQPHAFLYSGGSMLDLGTLGGYYSAAYGINSSGVVVGTSITGQPNSPGHAFVYSDGVMRDLNSLIDPLSGWTLEVAWGINDQGQVVGTGIIGGDEHAFILTPVPEPSMAALGLIGLLMVGCVGWRLRRNRFKR